MSPRMYGLVWAAYGVVAVILGLGGVVTLFVGVVFGFVAFGLVFMGMMCVLPAAVSHPVPAALPKAVTERARGRAAIPTFRSA